MERSHDNLRGMTCIRDNCKSCAKTYWNSKVTNATTGKTFIIEDTFKCSDTKVIYLITCKKCKLHYVGQTKRKYSIRVNEHLNNVNKNKNNTILVKHFTQEGHSSSDMQFSVLQKLTTDNELIPSEKFWIGALNCIFPFGLNDKIDGCGFATINKTKGKLPFFNNKIPRKKRSHGAKRTKIKDKTLTNTEVDEILQLIKLPTFEKTYIKLRSLNKYKLNKLYTILQSQDIFSKKQTDMLCAYIMTTTTTKKQNTDKPQNMGPTLKIHFVNKAIDDLQPGNIINDKRIRNLFPKQLTNGNIRTIYTYDNPIGQVLCNNNKITKSLTRQNMLQIIEEPCDCGKPANKSFIDNTKGHILTGDINCIKNKTIRNLLLKGAKYRNPVEYNLNKARSAAAKGITDFLKKTKNTMENGRLSYTTDT